MKPNGDGCSSWCYPDAGYICPEQDEPCQKCLRDERAEWGDETVCKFCSENSRVNVKNGLTALFCYWWYYYILKLNKINTRASSFKTLDLAATFFGGPPKINRGT